LYSSGTLLPGELKSIDLLADNCIVDSLRFVELTTVVMVALVMLMVIVTISLKALRYLKASWYKRHYKRIEPALEKFILTGEDQPKLLLLRPWQRDLFLSSLIVERIVLLRGAGQEALKRLAADLGLVEKYLKALKSRRRWRRARAAENLGYFGDERVVGPLGELLSDEDETIRAVAARGLARIGSDEAIRLLAQTLDDPSELTRLRVAENIERVGQPAVRPLVTLLEDATKHLLSFWFYSARYTPLVTLLEDATKHGAKQFYGQITAVRVLGNLRASEARDVLQRIAYAGKKSDLRAQTMLTLGKIGDPEDVPVLLKGAKDASWPVRAQAANALGMIGEVSTIPVLKGLAADQEWWVRLNACNALANMGPEGEKALLELLHGDDHYARARAAFTLEARGVTRRMVRQLAKPGKRGERARTIVEAVTRSGATKYLRDLSETLREGEERQILREMLGADETVNAKPMDAGAEQMELVEAESRAEQASTESANVEPRGTDPEGQRPDGPQVGGR
jgi:HEAT repeat protein